MNLAGQPAVNKVCVLGSFNVDMISYLPRLPETGESLLANKFIFSPGGKGCNQALAASYADAQVHFITKIGTDQFSDYAVNFISSSRIKTSTIYQTENHQTGTASIFVSEESGENIISIYSGANMDISSDEVKIQKDKIIDADIILLQLETNIEALKEIISIGNENNIPIILNPAPYNKIIDKLLPMLDILTPNETEASLLSGLLCDRFGIGVDEKKYFTPYRVLGAVLAVVATLFVVSPQWHSTSFIYLAILPFLAGLLAGWQPAGNSKVAEATGSMMVSITWNFIVGFTVLTIALVVRMALGHITLELPATWWMYLGGPLGLMSIALMAILVRGLGLLMLGVASTAGQLLGSVLIDLLLPSLGNTVYLVTIIGTLFALVGAIVTTIPEFKATKSVKRAGA
ncbi:PfkB family carbohydrate kinase [Proteus mirabilis]|uniref:PfkB family carbohydrate kinase n=5 Tax=Enterobacterales TaxID=91347 RepID=UPI00358DB2EB